MSSRYEGERTITSWDAHWQHLKLPVSPKLWAPSTYSFHKFFRRHLPPLKGKSVLEIGCCPGRWMVYFKRYHGALVTGVDYSGYACQVTRENLQILDVPAQVICADICEPELNIGTYDLVYSLGVVEHYRDLCSIIHDHAKFVSHGGYIVVTMPNYGGIHGHLIHRLDPARYSEHVPHSLEQLASAATTVHLTTISASAFGGIDPLLICGYRGRMAKIAAVGLSYATALIPVKGPTFSAYLGLICQKT